MLNYLPETINQYSSSTRASISSLIRNMKVSKADLPTLINKMNSNVIDRNFSAARIPAFSVISKEILIDSFRNLFLREQQLFSAANANGLVLTSMVDIFSSEIDKVQTDLDKLELFIDNYEFISGKDDLFNANYIEKFDSFINDYRSDNVTLTIPDRDNIAFGENGNAFIDSSLGVFKIGSSQDVKNIIRNIKNINIETNYDNYITTNNDFFNLFNDNFSDSWSITVKSPVILDSQIRKSLKYIEYDYTLIKGAVTSAEVDLQRSINIDTIRFNPNESNNFQLLQVVLFHNSPEQSNNLNSAEVYTTLLDRPKLINGVFELRFDKKNVKKIIFLFNQSNYIRSNKTPLVSELNSKVLDSFVKQIINDRTKRFSKFQDIVYWFFSRKNTVSGLSKNKYSDNDYYTYRFPSEFDSYISTLGDQIKDFNSLVMEDRNIFSNTPIFINLMNTMLDSFSGKLNIFDNTKYTEKGISSRSVSSLDQAGFGQYNSSNQISDYTNQFFNPIISFPNVSAVNNSQVIESENSYEYTFSLKSIELIETLNAESNKAVFISKKIPIDGQITAVKAKINQATNSLSVMSSQLDLKSPASYELSISNKPIPNRESDWTPIAPYGFSSIESEMLFFDPASKKATIRFNAIANSINIYKNGTLMPRGSVSYSYSSSNKTITLSSETFNPVDTYIASYSLDYSSAAPNEIDFIRQNIFLESVKSFGTENGPGEQFKQTDPNSYVRLSYAPYINKSAAANAFYSGSVGTTFAGNFSGYSPVRVQLSDGSYALNITNYTSSSQKNEFFQTNNTIFIHSGQGIIFNKNINTPFKVDYQYVPNDLRFRIILRKNIAESTDPISIDSLVLKMKTINYDSYYDKLNSTFR
jgi:hypothetical protein